MLTTEQGQVFEKQGFFIGTGAFLFTLPLYSQPMIQSSQDQ